MELKDFIKRALLDIVTGVEEANAEKNRFKLTSHVHHGTGESGQKVEFDISVIASETQENNKGGGIKVAVANIGVTEKTSELSHNTHKMKFEVFISEK